MKQINSSNLEKQSISFIDKKIFNDIYNSKTDNDLLSDFQFFEQEMDKLNIVVVNNLKYLKSIENFPLSHLVVFIDYLDYIFSIFPDIKERLFVALLKIEKKVIISKNSPLYFLYSDIGHSYSSKIHFYNLMRDLYFSLIDVMNNRNEEIKNYKKYKRNNKKIKGAVNE